MLKYIFVLTLASFLFLWKLGDTRLSNWDEAWYAGVSRSMAEKGNLLTPVWNGQPFYEKPPLFYWLTAGSMAFFGVSEFSARFVSAASAIATVGVVYASAMLLWGRGAAFASSLVLLSMPAYLYRARTGNIDSLLAFLLCVQMFCFIRMNKETSLWKILGFVTGLAVLTKGVIAVLALPIFFIWKPKSIAKAAALAFCVVLVWAGVSLLNDGGDYIRGLFIHQREKFISSQSVLANLSPIYIQYLKSGMKIWFLVGIPALLYYLYFWRRTLLLALPIYIVLFIFSLSVSESQSTWFLLPVYPVFALLIGGLLSKHKIAIGFLVLVASFQLIVYRDEYFVPDIARAEAEVALASQQYVGEQDVLYLTHYYYPTAAYYSRRTVVAVYSERPSVSFWIKSVNSWQEIFQEKPVYIHTTQEDLRQLKLRFPEFQFETLFSSGDKLLVKKV